MPDPLIESLRTTWDQFIADGGPFEMVPVDVRGTPQRVYKSAPPDLRSMWELATLHGDKTYLVYEDESLTFNETAAAVRKLAAALTELGVGRGDRVAVAMRNYPEWVISHWATISVGAAIVGMNAWWSAAEMRFGIEDSRPKVLIVDGERLERVAPALDELRADAPLEVIAVRTDDVPAGVASWDDVVVGRDDPGTLPTVAIDPDDDAIIFYTSGTTGFPKGAQLTHRGSVTNVMNVAFWNLVQAVALGSHAASTGSSAPPDAPAKPVVLAPTPLFHVTACNCIMQPVTIAGGTLVLLRKWDPGRALALIEREGVTALTGVPSMTRDLLLHPDWERTDTSSLISLGGGGAPVPPDLVEKVDASLSSSRGAPLIGYGLTETHGIVTANGAKFALAKPGSCGPAMPTVDVKLVDDEGVDLPAGADAAGELWVRGAIVVKGYLNRPDATAAGITDGWFHTGDIARIDEDGFVSIVDRAKDMVIRGGENVYCAEVENVIYRHPAVHEAVVIGVPDDRLGEAVAAVVVPHEGSAVDGDELGAFLSEHLAAYKVPSRWWFRSEPLPRNANGKFLKRELRDELV